MVRKRLPSTKSLIRQYYEDGNIRTETAFLRKTDPELTGETRLEYYKSYRAPNIDDILPFSREKLERNCSIKLSIQGRVHDVFLEISWYVPEEGNRTGWDNIQANLDKAWIIMSDCYISAWGENGYMATY